MGGIKSSFQFKSYKIDRVNFTMLQDIAILYHSETIDPDNLDIKIHIRQPMYFKDPKFYLGGINTLVEFELPNRFASDKLEKIFSLDIGIAGLFAVEERIDKKLELKLVKETIPALLFPYVRSTISNFFANAGFGSIVLPLVNIHAIAQQSMKDVEVKIIEQDKK